MKMRDISIWTAALLLGTLLTTGCSKESADEGLSAAGRPLTLRLEAEGVTTATRAIADDSTLETVTAYRFVGGVLAETLPAEVGSDGICTLYPTAPEGELRLVANDRSGLFDGVQPGVTTFEEFGRTTATAGEMTAGRLLMNGSTELSASLSGIRSVLLRRSVARLDIASPDQDVEVLRVTIRGIARSGYVIEPAAPATPDGVERSDFTKEYAETPLTNAREPLLYLCEQTGTPLEAEVLVSFGGGRHRMTATLPGTLRRNTVYTLRVHGAGSDLRVSVDADGWEEGAATDARPDLRGLVDVEASTLPAGVRVSDSRDSVYVGYLGATFRLAVRAEAGATVDVEGAARGVTTSVEAATRALEPVAGVAVSSPRRVPGEKRQYLYLTVRHGDVHRGRIVVVFEPNPILLSGALAFDEEGCCDFGKYVDGELGRLTLPEGRTIRVEFDGGEDPWLRLAEEQGAWRVLGGWKPNDPKADGRTQEARIVIAAADGSDAEQYVVRRRNEGLPVVKIGDTWWCKYNLRGNVKSFDDQISIQEDPAGDAALADYLAACSDDELLRILGGQYQAGNSNELPLRYADGAYYYEGMAATAGNFGTLDPTAMAPDGYRIPSYDDYAFFAANENYNLGGVGTRTYRNAAGEEITVRILEREAALLGHDYGTVALYEFRAGGSRWTLCGLGHQWNTSPGNIARMTLLLATWGDASRSWNMEGYAQADRPNQNWLKYSSQNTTKTRVIRCVKTPVEYIYE